MRFTTIFITRKKMILSGTVIFLAVFIMAGAVYIKNSKVIETFNEEDIYLTILEEGLAVENDDKISIRGIIEKIIGFDTTKPETIAEHELIMATASPSEEKAEDMSDTDGTNKNNEEKNKEPIMLLGHEEIHTASGLSVTNASAYPVNADAACMEEMPFKIDFDGPQVLVVHTHTTECYNGDAMSGETERTTDDEKNVVAVGNVICGILEEYGIETVHDTTVHDYPSYQGAYTRALTTINADLKKYPSVKVVLDIHRDAFVYEDGSKLRVACEQNGVSTAKVMLVVGTDSMGLSHPNWRENFSFAAKIQNTAEKMYPGLMRPINVRKERFNMHMTQGSLLLEVGSNGNSLSEAIEGGADVARAIAAVLENG